MSPYEEERFAYYEDRKDRNRALRLTSSQDDVESVETSISAQRRFTICRYVRYLMFSCWSRKAQIKDDQSNTNMRNKWNKLKDKKQGTLNQQNEKINEHILDAHTEEEGLLMKASSLQLMNSSNHGNGLRH